MLTGYVDSKYFVGKWGVISDEREKKERKETKEKDEKGKKEDEGVNVMCLIVDD